MYDKLKELLEGVAKAQELTAQVKKAYKTIKELRGLADSMPDCDSRSNILQEINSLEILAALDEFSVHKKMDKLVILQEEIFRDYTKLFMQYPNEDIEFKEKMVRTNPEYYYHESITPNMINQIDLSDTDTDTAVSLDEAEIQSMTEKLKAQSNLYMKYEGEAEEFKDKMLEVNPEYYYHESLGSSL
jgi:hypothetical protein